MSGVLRIATAWLLAAIVAPVVLAQSPVVTPAEGSRLKASFPFVRFSTLASFDLPASEGVVHVSTPPAADWALPPEVLSLHNRPVSIRGYMLPIDVAGGGVRSFILTSSIDSCHWGMLGLPNEWVLVEMAGMARVPFLKYQPVTVFGRLSVEPSFRGGRLGGLYQLRAEFMSADGL